MKKFAPLLLLLSILVSCENSDTTIGKKEFVGPIEFSTIAQGILNGNGEESISKSKLVINNSADWDTLIEKMNTVNNESSEFNELNIDFNQFSVIAVFDEVRMTGGYGIEVVGVLEDVSEIVVTTKINSPSGAYVITVVTQPYHIVKIPKSEKPVSFN